MAQYLGVMDVFFKKHAKHKGFLAKAAKKMHDDLEEETS